MISKIVITGDLLRLTPDPKHCDQIVNIEWLFNLFNHQLKSATNLDVELLHTDSYNFFDPREFFKLNELKPTHANWIKIYDKTPSQESLDYIKNYFENTLVVGFELPTIFLKAFEELSIPYIDIIIHPIRYLDDLLLAFRTSNSSIYTKLKKYQLDEEYYTIYANIHKATMSKMKKISLKENSILFAGQVEVDKSLISDNRLMSLKDYEKDLEKLSKEYFHIYVKMHPYAKDNDKIKTIFKKFPNVSYTNQNIYYLLAQKQIKALYSISSSTVMEAKYFGKKAEYLYQNPFYIDHKNTKPNNKEYISIEDSFYMTSFWCEILSEVLPTTDKKPLPLAKKTSRLRNSLQNYWAYKFLDSDILFKSYDLDSEYLNKSTLELIEDIRPQVEEERSKFEQKILSNKYIRYILQKLRRIPILGRFLYFIKQKILRWH